MRLRKVRLAGFKSFVDPTTISLPSDLIGIVGPNGCGKSNVIDAVRWVMGEVSAKHLRGDTMADVVFTGSNTRKPVGQASVELVFENADGRIGGRYAGYAEISVKRQVTRESQSTYFLNGTRCRRRDVMDVFLGTGLGPRSYAIIEQGMISRIIEARPEELREFLEEAAGISRYKERRRETENRIRHTNENLDRLADLRDEIGNRLTHLKRQATIAERYKVYKEEERELRGQLLALRWRALDAQALEQAKRQDAQRTALEAAVAAQRRTEADLARSREAHEQASEAFNEVYRTVLDAGAGIARTEESIRSLRQQREHLGAALETERQRARAARDHLQSESERTEALRAALAEDEPALERARSGASEARHEFRQCEEALHAWQAEWEALTERAAEPAQAAEAERARIQHVESNRAQLAARLERLRRERETLVTDPLEEAIESLARTEAEQQAEVASGEARVKTIEGSLAELRLKRDQRSAALHESRERLQSIGGRLASLEALQEEALDPDDAVAGWLQARGLSDRARLAEVLRVAPGWEGAVETVLGQRLESVCVDRVDAHAGRLGDLANGVLTLLAARPRGASGGTRGTWLGDRLERPEVVGSLLDGVYTADTLEAAFVLADGLGPGESVVTAEGVWVGPDWVRVARGQQESGVLERGREIERLREEQGRLTAAVEETAQAYESNSAALVEAESDHAAARDRLGVAHRELGEARTACAQARSRLDAMRSRAAAVREEIADLEGRHEAEGRLLETVRERLERTREQLSRINAEREAWSEQREQHRLRVEEARERWHARRDDAYEIGLRLESTRAQLESLGQATTRNREQIAAHDQRAAEIEASMTETESPLEAATQALARALGERSALETRLGAARTAMESIEAHTRSFDQSRQTDEQKVQSERAALEQLNVAAQEVLVRRKTLEEQLAETERRVEDVLETLPGDAHESAWAERIESLERRITRLGPINLAAIDEHTELAERKVYLDAQHEDLAEALATLTEAIQKIDRETRARFRETYEKVNDGLGRLFPRLFGGGQARLELTGDDLLNTGISVIARPPGKRNTSIHLLSGGEKALTAVAMVFAIFELNPAPFCLLDEVDAPLDDANVLRFCELVKEMSERVQIMVVTHNKITMEIAHHLLGVTMHEPGVSRLVSVDLDSAVELAAE